MHHLRVALALCLLGLLAKSFTDKTDVFVNGDEDAAVKTGTLWEATDALKEIYSRQSRQTGHRYCGICVPMKAVPVQMPCMTHRTTCVKTRKCGHWWRRRRCCDKYAQVLVKRYCCSHGIDVVVPEYNNEHLCIDRSSHCGGFINLKRAASAVCPACEYRGNKFCSVNYKLNGAVCEKKVRKADTREHRPPFRELYPIGKHGGSTLYNGRRPSTRWEGKTLSTSRADSGYRPSRGREGVRDLRSL